MTKPKATGRVRREWPCPMLYAVKTDWYGEEKGVRLVSGLPDRATALVYHFHNPPALPRVHRQLLKSDMRLLGIYESPREALERYIQRRELEIEDHERDIQEERERKAAAEALLRQVEVEEAARADGYVRGVLAHAAGQPLDGFPADSAGAFLEGWQAGWITARDEKGRADPEALEPESRGPREGDDA